MTMLFWGWLSHWVLRWLNGLQWLVALFWLGLPDRLINYVWQRLRIPFRGRWLWLQRLQLLVQSLFCIQMVYRGAQYLTDLKIWVLQCLEKCGNTIQNVTLH